MSQIAARSFSEKIFVVIGAIFRKRRERHQLRSLLALNDQMLSDIGLLRSDIYNALNSGGIGTAHLNAVVSMRRSQRLNAFTNDNAMAARQRAA